MVSKKWGWPGRGLSTQEVNDPKKEQLLYFKWSPPWHFNAYILRNILTYILTFNLTFYLASSLTYVLAYILTFFLAFYLVYLQRFFVVEVQRVTLWSWVCCWGQAGTTAISSLQLRSGGEGEGEGGGQLT